MKKNSAALLAILLVFSLLIAGCGNTAPSSTPTATASASTDPTPETKTEAPADPLGKYEQTVTVNFMRPASAGAKFLEGESYDNNVWIREYESELGIKVVNSITVEGEDNYTNRLNLLIASGDLPDMFKLMNAGQMERLSRLGLIEDLTAVYENYASPFVKEVIGKDKGVAIEQLTVNGKLLAYPTSPVVPMNMRYTFVRDDIRKALGIEKPQTMEELIEFARASVKAGKTQYGFSFGNKPYDSYMDMAGFFNAYGAFPTLWVEKEGKLAYGSVQPEMKAALASLKALYDEKLIDPEFVVKDPYAASQDVVAGKAAICYADGWLITWPLPDAFNADNTVDWRFYPITHSTSSSEKMVQATSSALVPSANTYCVRKGFSNPEAIAKLHNYYMEKSYGATADEVKYRNNGDVYVGGLATIVGGMGTNNIDQYKMITKAIDTSDESVLSTAESKVTYQSVKAGLAGSTNAGENYFMKLFYGPDCRFAIEDNWMTNNLLKVNAFYGADTPEMLRRMSILRTSEEEMILKIITGQEPLDYFDAFVKSWNELGGEIITAEVNQWKKLK